MSLPRLPQLAEIRGRLERIFPDGLAGRGDLVRELAARTVLTALYVGAVGDPDRDGARLLRPSMVTWMSDEALTKAGDDAFRIAWHQAARRSRGSVASLLATVAEPHVPWYADNTREPIRDEVLRVWREQYGAVQSRADLPSTSPAASMTLAEDFAGLFDSELSDAALNQAIGVWQVAHLGRAEQERLRVQRRLDETKGQVRVTLPGRGNRLLPPGTSSVLVRAVLEELAPRLLGEPYVLAICHGGDPTADDDRMELERAKLLLSESSALPDVIMLDVHDGTLWLIEIVVTGGALTERRRQDLLDWATAHGFSAAGCRFLAVYRSRSEPIFRRTVGTLAWQILVWFADEPDKAARLLELT